MLTGDLNAAVVEWVVQYRIVEPYMYLFRVRNVQMTFRDMSEAAMRRVVGDRTVNEVLTVGRQEIADQVLQELQGLCDNAVALLSAEKVPPGMYDVICTPDVSGVIAHEAFGHGVELDMFLKG